MCTSNMSSFYSLCLQIKSLKMIPNEYFATGEIITTSSKSYVIVLEPQSETTEANAISVKITDAEKFLVGKIDIEEIVKISEKLGITDEKLSECFRKAIRERTPTFTENENQVKFFLIHGTKTTQVTTQLEAVNETDSKPLAVKNLIFGMARHIKKVEDSMAIANKAQAFIPGFGNHILGPHAYGKKIPKAKRLNPGMSIINPGSRRAKTKPGVQFNKVSSDESD